ncbi:TPA: RES family NAD+ phosphorylase [Photobacterium damselae]|uniref:RES family NAD+ phosphorylase n=1 Tax=Vibrio harveyi TaxID=669 RepID=UPI003BB5286B
MSETKLILDLDYMHDLAKNIKASNSEKDVHDGLKYALQFYDIINFEFKYGRSFLRARVAQDEQGFKSTSEIYYPPHHVANVGRVNDKGSPFLYLSLTMDVALAEVGAQEGDIVQISAFKPKSKPIRLGIIGEKYKASRGTSSFLPRETTEVLSSLVNKLEKEDRKKAMAYLYPDMFFDDLMTDKKASEFNYIHSRALARLMLDKQRTLDGLLYHSVASFGGTNVALPCDKADSLLGLEYTFLIKVKRAYDYGLYDVEVLKRPREIQQDGTIVWHL